MNDRAIPVLIISALLLNSCGLQKINDEPAPRFSALPMWVVGCSSTDGPVITYTDQQGDTKSIDPATGQIEIMAHGQPIDITLSVDGDWVFNQTSQEETKFGLQITLFEHATKAHLVSAVPLTGSFSLLLLGPAPKSEQCLAAAKIKID